MKIKVEEVYEDGSVILQIDGHQFAGMVGKTYEVDFTKDPFTGSVEVPEENYD